MQFYRSSWFKNIPDIHHRSGRFVFVVHSELVWCCSGWLLDVVCWAVGCIGGWRRCDTLVVRAHHGVNMRRQKESMTTFDIGYWSALGPDKQLTVQACLARAWKTLLVESLAMLPLLLGWYPGHVKAGQWSSPSDTDSWGLWPRVTELMRCQVEQEYVSVIYRYAEKRAGRHPEMCRCAAEMHVQGIPALHLRAKATTLMASSRLWQAEVVICSAILAVMHRVRVRIEGLTFDLAELLADICAKKTSNPHLSEMVLKAVPLIETEEGDGILIEAMPTYQQMEEELEPNPGIRTNFEKNMRLAVSLSKFCELTGDLYPVAKQLTHEHANSRGGNCEPLYLCGDSVPFSFLLLGCPVGFPLFLLCGAWWFTLGWGGLLMSYSPLKCRHEKQHLMQSAAYSRSCTAS